MRKRLAEAARRFAFQRSIGTRGCAHISEVRAAGPHQHLCAACEARGDAWLKLRMCLTCGNVGCCDSSAGQHARDHFDATGHPVMRSIEPGEAWAWCYVDQAYLGSIPASPLAAS